jgi:ABC-type branched-subunit amino acid transport system substrate-binding protein
MPIYYAWGYDGVQILARAIASSSGVRTSVRDTLQATRYTGALGDVSFTPQGSWQDEVSVFVVRSRELVRVDR